MDRKLHILAAAGLAYAVAMAGANAEDAPARPTFDENGTVHVPAFKLPPSELSSKEAQEFMKLRAQMPTDVPIDDMDIEKSRAGLAAMLAPQVAGMLQVHPVDIAEETINGVPVRIITPKDKEVDPERVLINLHGGAFQTCWEPCSVLESAPIASVGGYKVVSVNYRMAPEATHPAGVEDVAKVYGELLRSYEPNHIGIYGCSAGGALTAQAAAWLPAHDMPQAGAIGIFGAGAVRFNTGDSAYIAGYVDGSFPPPPEPGAERVDRTRGYFAGADMSDEIISPALHPDVIAKFPPAIVITGTRAMDMSPAIVTNSRLLSAGVESTLIVGEAMGHCYLYTAHFPESQDAYAAIVAHFQKHLR